MSDSCWLSEVLSDSSGLCPRFRRECFPEGADLAPLRSLYTNYAALQYLSLADASTLWFISPVLVGILGWLILREPYSRLEALVGLASLSGTVFIAKPTFLFPARGGITEDVPGHAVTPEQRALAVSIVLFGVVASSGVSIIIRYIGTRASALHSISYFALYSVESMTSSPNLDLVWLISFTSVRPLSRSPIPSSSTLHRCSASPLASLFCFCPSECSGFCHKYS